MLEAGFPEGVFQNLILKRDDVVNVINDGRVQGASVTGSVRAGSAVASEAGKVIKKTVMELGGSDAFIVCEDADIPKAVAAGIRGRFHNAGQVCLAAKRFILVGKIADEFERSFVEAACLCASVILSILRWIWGRWPVPTFVTRCTNRWKAARQRAQACCAAVSQ
jgi:acyl-CoA reductase-like NAD-dependent aldehyde dehydrogenase